MVADCARVYTVKSAQGTERKIAMRCGSTDVVDDRWFYFASR